MAPRKSFLLRINAELWDELSRWAAEEFRSVNGQIEYLLRRSVEDYRGRRREPAASAGESGEGEPEAIDPE